MRRTRIEIWIDGEHKDASITVFGDGRVDSHYNIFENDKTGSNVAGEKAYSKEPMKKMKLNDLNNELSGLVGENQSKLLLEMFGWKI